MFNKDKCVVNKGGKVLGQGKRDEIMYSIELPKDNENALAVAEEKSQKLDISHQMLAHAARRVVK